MRCLITRLLLSSLALLGPAALAATTEYTVQIQNARGGRLLVEQDSQGRITTDFSYRNNGRGPDMREALQVNPQGEVMSYTVQGTSTFGAAIQESFSRQEGRLRWTSRIDRGDEAADNGTLFVPLESTPAYLAQLAHALLTRADRSAVVVGGARLTAETHGSLTLQPASGPVTVQLVSIHGADTQPWYVWLRQGGAEHGALAGLTEPDWQVLPKGWEEQAEAMVNHQRAVQNARLGLLRQKLARPLTGLTVIRQVRWFDARAARMQGPSDVWLHGGRITAITPSGALSLSADQSIDGKQRTLLPGLFDMHVHLSLAEGPLHLAAGVTTVRDMGSKNTEMALNRQRIARGEVAAPHIVPYGFIEGKSPFSSSADFLIEHLDAGKAAIDWYAAHGYRAIKLYNSIKPEWVQPLAAYARSRGLRVSGHVPAFMRAEQAVRAGYDELTHINQVMLNFVTRPGDDSRTLLRFTRVGDDAGQLDLSSPRARAFVKLLRDRGVAVDPTLVVFESMLTQRQGDPSPSLADVADHLPAMWRRYVKVAWMDLEGPKLQTYRRSYQRLLDLTRALHQAGVPLVPGTDGNTGVGLHRELALYVQAGLSPAQALQAATWTSAQVAGEGHERGSIERGKVADLVLVDGDPSVRITDLRRASLVIQGTVAWEPARLYQAMGFKPFVEPARLEAAQPTSSR
jgi:hypothetical protein